MTTVAARPTPTRPHPIRRQVRGSALARIVRTTDAKQIGIMYMITSIIFYVIGGIMALLMRAELARPGMQILSPEQYNQLFTMHGTAMLLFFATPIVFAFGNFVVPIQIGAPDVAFPRLNAFAYWLYLFGTLIAISGFITPGGAADFGWFAYTPLSDSLHSPGIGGNCWVVGLAISGLGTILGSVNLITTILTLRAPGMTMFRMPIMTWNMLVTALLAIMVFPFLAAALFALAADRVLGAHVFDVATGGPMLWQHLFWFFGHPEVYIIALPFFGIITEVIPVFSRKPLFGYKGLVAATIAIAALSMSVWAHHMYATGQVLLPFFSFLTFMIGVPTGMKFFTWIGTMWRGQISFETPMLFAVGFLVTFLFGGLSGIILASPPMDFHVSDSYFVVAHFHYVLFGTIVFAVFSGIYFWFPKMFGRMLDERLGKVHFWLTMIGFHTTFLVQHWLGTRGMPRRYADFLPTDGFTGLNTISSIGSFILGAATLPFLYNVWRSYKVGKVVTEDDPWGHGNSLEWATSSPPPLRNFDRMPRIRSERPAFDLKYPHLAAGEQSLAGPPEGGARPLTRESDGGATYAEDIAADRDRKRKR
ncbi:cytochrome C oxidase subunit I [Actinoplanes sp. SE50]|uniref:aa3-type cytochrome oxidase subunit I n=1 Tax=unclassified Actinoplanes TaxID=2626549 RepID=UPI00023EC43D|nr:MULTISPECIES: cytochrome c oxidase subunit I [unclassified Actinoplanes]AEV83605.1 cytochrome c oxidase subunit I [Actinoplanes sp. SE50/110]ATO82251.1 cytochrome C oxidase subunit I [Actinoplanes sp. SE50]SLL99658.1 cytochrome ubiquinol oxidase subunit I [Actinoplanes sp. SE50/110]